MSSLKRDYDMKWLKPKTTSHFKKVDDKLREELKRNLIEEMPELNKFKRFSMLLDRIPNLNVSVSTIG
jgi:hypothetical protein